MTRKQRRTKTRTRRETYGDEELLIKALVAIAQEAAARRQEAITDD
jgi:hypothetical protein